MGGHEKSHGLLGQKMTLYAEVILSLPFDHMFTYRIPPSLQDKAKIGSRALVPFKERTLTGFIVNFRRRKPSKGLELRDILEILDEDPVFSSSFLSYTRKLSSYHHSSWGEILQASLPPSLLLKTETRVSLREEGKRALEQEDLSKDDKKVLSILQKKEYSVFFIRRKLKIKNLSFLLRRLERKGFIHIQKTVKQGKIRKEPKRMKEPKQLEIDFSMDRASRHAADMMAQKMKEDRFSPFLLHSSREKRQAVYFHFIRKCLEKKKRVLFLVPEISLTEDFIGKFERRLGKKVACLHSRLSEKRRVSEWERIKESEVDVIIGPRSALFSPIEMTGLVIVDEEHDESYYQLESPSYDARRGAWLKAQEEECVLIYGSATPSVEMFYRAKKGGYLQSVRERTGKIRVEVLDDRKSRGIIPSRMREGIEERLRKKEPVLIFINRRGYASFLYCSRCNFIPRCPRCDISLTYHKREDKLVCHYCDYSSSRIDECTRCGSKIIRRRGPGIEVIEEELKVSFPQSRVVCFDKDVARTKTDQERILKAYSRGKIDILIGTQLLARQMDLSPASLVAILYPEITLSLSDFRATHKTYHNLRQMMSFVNNEKGEVLIQTSFPLHFSILSAVDDDYLSFYNQEIKFRRLMNYPPFCTMGEILFLGENLKTLAKKSREFFSRVKSRAEEVEVLGPALASGPRLRGRKGIQLILKAKRRKRLDDVIRKFLQPLKVRKSVWIYN